jgi:UDP-glucuronate decarboxylase
MRVCLSLCSKSPLLVLLFGILIGYVIVPVILVHRIDFDSMFSPVLLERKDSLRFQGDLAKSPDGYIRKGNSPLDSQVVTPLAGHRFTGTASQSAVHKWWSLPLDTSQLTETERRFIDDKSMMGLQSIPTATTPHIMKTAKLPDSKRMKILVTGGAGFVGSHLVDKLMMQGHEVTVLDNFFTGQKKNVEHWFQHPNFSLVTHDVTEPIMLEVDQIYHLACPASPPHYQYNPVKTIKTSTMGTINMLGLAKRVKARVLLASTSEIYGDPQVHPQPETYWGNVNTIGPRSCYDEGKRVAETMMYSYREQNHVEVRVARIFNTFGPRMHPNDGRVVSNFIIQALQDKPLTIYGDGQQTRSFQYVSDLVDGLYALMNGSYDGPVNLGNPDEYSVEEFANYIKEITQSDSDIQFLDKSQDDPSQRRPDISLAKEKIDWEPKITVRDGLVETIAYFQRVLDEAGEIIPTGPGASKPKGITKEE